MGNPVKALLRGLHGPVYASRLRALTAAIAPHLRDGDRVLDVGCGGGALGAALMQARPGVTVEGLERAVREGTLITVHGYDASTGRLPFDDDAFDVVILADVLHHEHDEARLIAECARLARRLVIIKDHQVRGIFGRQRISALDWLANFGYGVPCLFRYHTPAEWADIHAQHNLREVEVRRGMRLYPPGFELVFGGGLHVLSVLAVPGTPAEQPFPDPAPQSARTQGAAQ